MHGECHLGPAASGTETPRQRASEGDAPAPVERPALGDVLTSVFGISETEWRTYRAVLDHPKCTTSELTTALSVGRSNVNRHLQALREKGLVTRTRRLLDTGGHVYLYEATPLEAAKPRMHRVLDDWTAHAHTQIEEIGRTHGPPGQTTGADP